MAGTRKVGKKGLPAEAPAVAGAAEAKGEGKAARAEEREAPRAGRSVPLPSGVAEDKLPAKAWVLLAASILMFVVGGMMFIFQMDWAGPREVWIISGAVLAIGGFAALAYFFDKWGRL